MATWHVPAPVQAPLQPAKDDPMAASALTVINEPLLYVSEQSLPQLIPTGLLVTVPAPLPSFTTVRAYVCGGFAHKAPPAQKVGGLHK